MNEFSVEDTVILHGGSVEYSAEKAATPINDLIALLESAKSEGATHVLLSSGNYRGAQYASIGNMYDWLDDNEDEVML